MGLVINNETMINERNRESLISLHVFEYESFPDFGVDMATNTDDGIAMELDNAANFPPMFSVGTSPPSAGSGNVNNNQVVVYNNNNNNPPRSRSGSLSSPGRGSLRRTPSLTGASPMAQSPSTPGGVPPPCPFGTSPSTMEGPILFEAPDLPEETLLPAAHNETMSKLTYILSLVDCVIDVAKTRATPISYLTICNNNNINDNDRGPVLKNRNSNVANNNEVINALNNNNQNGKSQSTTNTTTSSFPTHQLCTLSGKIRSIRPKMPPCARWNDCMMTRLHILDTKS